MKDGGGHSLRLRNSNEAKPKKRSRATVTAENRAAELSAGHPTGAGDHLGSRFVSAAPIKSGLF
jgi:hypothetical protein